MLTNLAAATSQNDAETIEKPMDVEDSVGEAHNKH